MRRPLKGRTVKGLTFIKPASPYQGNSRKWEVRCYCGKTFVAWASNIIAKKQRTKSCGCLYRKTRGKTKHWEFREVTYKGETRLLIDLLKETEVKRDTLYNRLFRYGWSVEKAMETAV